MPSVTSPGEHAPDGTPFRHPARPEQKRSLRRAFRHYRELLRDKEATNHVFHIYDALPSRRSEQLARRLSLSPHGDMLRRKEPYLPDLLDDHAALRQLPKGSVAHAYCDFMQGEQLTAAGLAEQQKKMGRPRYGDLLEWFSWRQRDTHDLLHVLTGYGRDALGEACVLLFTHGHSPSKAHLLLGYSGGVKIRRQVKSKAPVLKAVREAHRLGADCEGLIHHPVSEILMMDFEKARERFGFRRPDAYHRCHEVWHLEGHDPARMLQVA